MQAGIADHPPATLGAQVLILLSPDSRLQITVRGRKNGRGVKKSPNGYVQYERSGNDGRTAGLWSRSQCDVGGFSSGLLAIRPAIETKKGGHVLLNALTVREPQLHRAKQLSFCLCVRPAPAFNPVA